MMRLISFMICLASSVNAGCDGVEGTAFELQPDESILMINLFPVTANSETITYAVCPVVALQSGNEVTDCRIGVTDRDVELISLAPLGTCTAQYPWTSKCPDFTGEGFTAGNRAAVEALIAAEGLACRDAARPRPLPQQIERGGDGGLDTHRTYDFEVVSTCDSFVGHAGEICNTLPVSDAPLFAFEAVGRTTICTVGHGNRLTTCRSD